jgi:phage I-like protein
MKAQEEAEKNASPQGSESHAQTQQVSAEPVQPVVQETVQTEPAPNQIGTETVTQTEPEEPKPQVFEIDGKEVSLEELQRGYLRQSDYTKKTQEVARKERELAQARQIMEQVQAKPELAQAVGFDPQASRMQELESELFDLRLQQEVATLSSKYADFDVNEVINFAVNREMTNLEDAYLLNKQYKGFTAPQQVNTQTVQPTASVDVEALKAQIRAELQAEMNTSTIISGSGQAPSTPNPIQLSDAEMRVAKKMGLSPEEYAKWR